VKGGRISLELAVTNVAIVTLYAFIAAILDDVTTSTMRQVMLFAIVILY